MKSQIRIATLNDADSFINIKNQLPLTRTDGSTTTGGFLLGTDIETYRHYIRHAYCLVAEVNELVVGFGILFHDEMLRQSDIWQRRHMAQWNIHLPDYEKKKLCYFEQLAFLSGHRKLVIILAYHLVKQAFDKGYDFLLTSTVNAPVTNLAAIPFIRVVEGLKAGNIDEEYPLVGHINSDIYLIESHQFYARAKAHPLYSFLNQETVTFV